VTTIIDANDTTKARRRNALFSALLLVLLLATSNIFLINQRLSLKGSVGNVLGLRDIAFLALIVGGLPLLDGWTKNLTRSGAWRLCLFVLFLTLVGTLRAFLDPNREIRMILSEAVGLACWLLPLFVAAHVRSVETLSKWTLVLTVLGVLVSIGSLLETFMGVALVTGGTGYDSLTGQTAVWRSSPTCWPLMNIAGSFLLDYCIGIRRIHLRVRVFSGICLLCVVLACLLTQSRTLLVGLVVSALGMLILGRCKRVRIGAAVMAVLAVIMIPLTAHILGQLMGDVVEEGYMRRYAVLSGVNSAAEYAPEDGRTSEIAVAFEDPGRWVWFGVGIAGRYRQDIYVGEEFSQLAHNNILFFASRFGLAGLAAFGLLVYVTIRAVGRIARSRPDPPQSSLGLCTASLSLLVCSQFAPIYAFNYATPVTLTVLGLLMAAEKLAGRRLAPFNSKRSEDSYAARGESGLEVWSKAQQPICSRHSRA
jgi:O-antigen ligase